jgi:hypothetical protein
LASINLLEVEMAVELLRASEAARRLGMPTKDLLRLVHGVVTRAGERSFELQSRARGRAGDIGVLRVRR